MKAFINDSSYRQSKSSSGFTLIELMVTIAVLAIIVSIAAPNISNQLANQRVKSTTATLVNALKEAKVESVIRRQETELSIDNNEIKIEVDDNDNDNDNDNDSIIIASYSYNAKSTIDGDDDIEFKPNRVTDERTFTICDINKAATSRKVNVTKLGNISSQVNTEGDCL